MTARSCVFQIYQPNFSEWNLISDFFCVFVFMTIKEQSDQRLFFCLLDAAIYHFSIFSLTSPYLSWRASLVPAYYRVKFSFCKKSVKDCVSLMVICGPQNFQMAPQKIGRGPDMALKITDLGTTLSLHGRMYYPRYYLSKFEAYIKRWDPQFQ